jgi:hypothetical protein
MRFDLSISHVAGKDLNIADTLSRAPVENMSQQCFPCSDHNDLMSRKKQAHVLSAGMHFLWPCPKFTRYLVRSYAERKMRVFETVS